MNLLKDSYFFEVEGKHENVYRGFSQKLIYKFSSGNRTYAITIDLFIDVLFDDSMNFRNLYLMSNQLLG